MLREQLKERIAFSMIKHINAGTARGLIDRCGDESTFFRLTDSELRGLTGLPENIISSSIRKELLKCAEKELLFVTSSGIQMLYFLDEEYPWRLKECDDAPVMLYKLGNADLDNSHIVSIVGTRNSTVQGIEVTRSIVKELGEKLDNLIIVSGLAYGIDVAAHKAALEFNIPTVAVTAHPLNTIYPPEHRNIAAQMVRAGGAILSEYSTSHSVYKANFLARNRIVASLADATIIVESDQKGGSLVTAALASAYNREVFAVPGRLTDRYSRGTLNLIAKNGARIYVSADDLIEQMGWTSVKTEGEQLFLPVELNQEEKNIIDFLNANPASTVNEIMISTGIKSGMLKDILFQMEMKDLILSLAGGRYSAV